MASSRTMALAMLMISSFLFLSTHASSDSFLQCLSATIPSQVLVTRSSPLFASVLTSSVRNPRFLTEATAKPLCIVAATNASHVQAAVVCGRTHGVRLRVRSGGHDYEGLSYRSARPDAPPFAVVDLAGLRSVRVTRGSPATAWVDSGAQLGELYYAIGKVSKLLAFPGGLCPTLGVGGHLSGGGFGMLLRRHGLAADQVVDALLVNAEGRLLDRNAMGSDVFWAIRGGGVGASFGIVLSWKVNLVAVPPKVTAFTVTKTVQEGAVDIIAKWQEVAPALPNDLLVKVIAQGQEARFQALYLGTFDALLAVMRSRFPELGMNKSHCKEMTWLQSVAFIYLGTNAPVEDILKRTLPGDAVFSRATTDFVRQAISRNTWAEIFRTWLAGPNAGLMTLEPFGGEIAAVSDSETPFPHRSGVLYNVQYMNLWGNASEEAARMGWVRDMYSFMAPHVSKNPRKAYANYRDLDLGQNAVDGGAGGNLTSFEAGKVWGEKYYMGNFRRLAMAKAKIDPTDYFRSEQSIPPIGNQLILTSIERVDHTE